MYTLTMIRMIVTTPMLHENKNDIDDNMYICYIYKYILTKPTITPRIEDLDSRLSEIIPLNLAGHMEQNQAKLYLRHPNLDLICLNFSQI